MRGQCASGSSPTTTEFLQYLKIEGASLVAQTVKNPPAMKEMWFQSLGQEGPVEKEMATHSSNLAWRILGQRSLAGYSPWDCTVGHN